MPTSHGVDIETATSKSAYDVSEFKDYVVYIAPKVEVIKQGVVTLFLLIIGCSHQEPCAGKLACTVWNWSWRGRPLFRPYQIAWFRRLHLWTGCCRQSRTKPEININIRLCPVLFKFYRAELINDRSLPDHCYMVTATIYCDYIYGEADLGWRGDRCSIREIREQIVSC